MSPHLRVLRYGVQPEDWQEDFAHENGNYENICTQCGCGFIGHKRRMVCRKCTMEERERWARMDDVGFFNAAVPRSLLDSATLK